MKVILTQEIKGRGGEGDVIEVKYGYAINYLFPNKLAIKATPGELKQLELRRHNIEKREVARMDDANQAVEYLTGKIVGIPMKVGEEGRLFGSVTAHMIADALHEQHGLEIDRRKIEVHTPIKELGDHLVDINVYRDLKAPITVHVVADGEAIDTGITSEEAAEMVDSGAIAEAFAADETAEGAAGEASASAGEPSQPTELLDAADVEQYDSAVMPADSADVDYDAPGTNAADESTDEWVVFDESDVDEEGANEAADAE